MTNQHNPQRTAIQAEICRQDIIIAKLRVDNNRLETDNAALKRQVEALKRQQRVNLPVVNIISNPSGPSWVKALYDESEKDNLKTRVADLEAAIRFHNGAVEYRDSKTIDEEHATAKADAMQAAEEELRRVLK